jgi:hypothetical protein
VLDPHPERGAAVADLIRAVADRKLQTSLVVLLDRLGIARHRQAVHRIVNQPAYAGLIRCALTDGQLVPAAWPGIVDRETWERARAALTGLRTYGPRTSAGWPLRSWLRCGICGRGITGGVSRGHGGRYDYYACQRPGCSRIRRDELHDAFRVWMRGQCATALPILNALRKMIHAAMADQQSDVRMAATAARRRVTAADGKIARLLDGYVSGVIAPGVYKSKQAELELERGAALAAVHDADLAGLSVDSVCRMADALLTDADRIWANCETDNQRRLQVGLWGASVAWSRERGFEPQPNAGIIGTCALLRAPPSGVAYLADTILNLQAALSALGDLVRAA